MVDLRVSAPARSAACVRLRPRRCCDRGARGMRRGRTSGTQDLQMIPGAATGGRDASVTVRWSLGRQEQSPRAGESTPARGGALWRSAPGSPLARGWDTLPRRVPARPRGARLPSRESQRRLEQRQLMVGCEEGIVKAGERQCRRLRRIRTQAARCGREAGCLDRSGGARFRC
jgi:hypothetical protein